MGCSGSNCSSISALNTIRRCVPMPVMTACSKRGEGSDLATTRSGSFAPSTLARTARTFASSRWRSITRAGRFRPARFRAWANWLK